jgi:hypothetical protein
MQSWRAVFWLLVSGLVVGMWLGIFPSGAAAFYPPGTMTHAPKGQPPPPTNETPPPPPGEQSPPGETPPEAQGPEPATLITGLLGTGLLSLFALARRKLGKANEMSTT